MENMNMTKEQFIKAWNENKEGFRYEWRRRGVYVVGNTVVFTKTGRGVVAV